MQIKSESGYFIYINCVISNCNKEYNFLLPFNNNKKDLFNKAIIPKQIYILSNNLK